MSKWREETIGGQRLICGDCLEVLPELKAGSVDAVVTDPPYGIPGGAAFVRCGGIDVQDWKDATQNVAVEGWLALVPFADEALLVEFGRTHPEAVVAMIERHSAAGFTPWRFLSLVKQAPPPTPRPTMVSGFEYGLVSYRGERRWYGSGYVPDRWIGLTPNRLACGLVPTQKPLEPFVLWMEALTSESATVLDPFLGSGTTLVAAELLGRRGIGIEIDPGYFDVACRRVEDATKQPRLFQPDAQPRAEQLTLE